MAPDFYSTPADAAPRPSAPDLTSTPSFHNSSPLPGAASVQLHSSSPHTPRSESSPSIPSATTTLRWNDGRSSYDCYGESKSASGKSRRRTFDDAARDSRLSPESASTSTSDNVQTKERPAAATQQRVPRHKRSWIKRLSTMSSRSSSPRSTIDRNSSRSPVVSLSNSTAPMVDSRASVEASTPNKLVKRASSQRLDGMPGMPSRNLTLRRPATSHQRTVALQQHPHLVSQRLDNQNLQSVRPSVEGRNDEVRWKQFFSIRSSRSASRKASPIELGKQRESLQDDGCFPAVISAKSVVTSFDVDDVLGHGERSSDFGSRGDTTGENPYHTTTLSATKRGIWSSSPPRPFRRTSRSGEDIPSRKLFALQDLLSLGPSRGKSTRRPAKLVKRNNSRRVCSDPVSSRVLSDYSPNGERASKRRDITDPSIFRKTVNAPRATRHVRGSPVAVDALPSSPSTLESENRSPAFSSEEFSPSLSIANSFSGAFRAQHHYRPPVSSHSSIHSQPQYRVFTYSTTPSEHTSTLVGSDNEAKGFISLEDEDTDLGSESLFDSLRTRGTRSTSGTRRGRVEAIFDESPLQSKKKGLRDILPEGMLATSKPTAKDHSVIEEEESVATPVRTIRSDRADDGSPVPKRTHLKPVPLSLTPNPDKSKALNLGTLEYDDALVEEDDDSRWSCVDASSHVSTIDDGDSANFDQEATPLALRTPNSFSKSGSSLATPKPEFDGIGRDLKRDTRSSIFDYSEHLAEKSPGSNSPPRPRTVHGKKDADRGSRPVGRRAPSGLHARSQSVPVVPDVAGKRETVMTNKFGTWGVGSKGVSEDWNDDFDFEDDPILGSTCDCGEERRIDSGVGMHIPQTIRDQQVKVVNNIGLVREFGILVEELKSLRNIASGYGFMESTESSPWQEIDAMIDLADQEVEDPVIPRPSSPSSPALDALMFESGSDITSVQPKKLSTPAPQRTRSRSRRQSVLPEQSDVFTTPPNSQFTSSALKSSPASVSLPVTSRPRKDSEATARSVIEALRKKRDSNEGALSLRPIPSNKKVPFDTNTLRHIVPYVNGLVRKAKETLRVHGAPTGDRRRSASDSLGEQPLAELFKDPSVGTPSPGPVKNTKVADLSSSDELPGKMKLMTLRETHSQKS